MEVLLEKYPSISSLYPAQTALSIGFHRRWGSYGSELLHCYDIVGLTPDNLRLESVFGKLRNHARWVTGRKSTRELRDFGQCQILFLAESAEDLVEQMLQVPLSTYQAQRELLEKAEAPQKFIRQLHRDTLKTTRNLLSKYPNAQGRKERQQPNHNLKEEEVVLQFQFAQRKNVYPISNSGHQHH